MRGRKPVGRPRAFTLADVTSALDASNSIAGAAQLLGCTAPAIHFHARRNLDVKAAVKNQGKDFESRLAECILRHHGVVAKVAEEMSVEPASIRHHLYHSARLRAVLTDAREGIIDTAEDNIFRAVEAGDLKYSWNVLRTLGKDRGYTERRELDAVVTHTVDEASTERLVQLLDRLAGEHPEAVEAEFRSLSEEERKELQEALQSASPEAAGGSGAQHTAVGSVQ